MSNSTEILPNSTYVLFIFLHGGSLNSERRYKIGISKIREVAGTDKQRTNAYGVIKAAGQLGFFHLLLLQKSLYFKYYWHRWYIRCSVYLRHFTSRC